MTVYDINKLAYQNIPPITNIDGMKNQILNYINENPSKYYMLLCNDIHYYTMFISRANLKPKRITGEIFDIVNSLGEIKDIVTTENGLEFWINYENEVKMFILFDYARGVIEV